MREQIDWDWLIPALRKTIDGGCAIPMLRPAYTRHSRIQMPRAMTEAEQTRLQIELDLLPCQCTFEPTKAGHNMHVYYEYQGG